MLGRQLRRVLLAKRMITFGSHSLITLKYSKYNKNDVKYREADLGFPVLRLEYCSRFVKINTFSRQAGSVGRREIYMSIEYIIFALGILACLLILVRALRNYKLLNSKYMKLQTAICLNNCPNSFFKTKDFFFMKNGICLSRYINSCFFH